MILSNVQKTQTAMGRWTYIFSIAPDYMRREYAWRVLQFGIFKRIRETPMGAEMGPGDYRGFLFVMRFWFPVLVDRWW